MSKTPYHIFDDVQYMEIKMEEVETEEAKRNKKYTELQRYFIEHNVTGFCEYDSSGMNACYVDCKKFMDCWKELEEKVLKKNES